MEWAYWTAVATARQVTRNERDWFLWFDDGTTLRGWDAILHYIGSNGWEILSVCSESETGVSGMGKHDVYTDQYRFFCRQPVDRG